MIVHRRDGTEAFDTGDERVENNRITDLSGLLIGNAHIYESGINYTGSSLTPFSIEPCGLKGSLMNDVDVGHPIPKVPDLEERTRGKALDMYTFGEEHNLCGTSMCVAGWIMAAGVELLGAMRDEVAFTAALIYAASTGKPIPDFYTTNLVARAEIERRAQ